MKTIKSKYRSAGEPDVLRKVVQEDVAVLRGLVRVLVAEHLDHLALVPVCVIQLVT